MAASSGEDLTGAEMDLRSRRNSLFYKTQRGARVGDLFMSLIYTCQLSNANPFDYLTVLHRNADRLAREPAQWMPWNYSETAGQSHARFASQLTWLDVTHACRKDTNAQNGLGSVLDDQGKIAESIAQYAEVLRLKPDFAAAHNNMAAALVKLGRVDEAVKEELEAIRLDTSQPDY